MKGCERYFSFKAVADLYRAAKHKGQYALVTAEDRTTLADQAGSIDQVGDLMMTSIIRHPHILVDVQLRCLSPAQRE
jgi:hypothetical protein